MVSAFFQRPGYFVCRDALSALGLEYFDYSLPPIFIRPGILILLLLLAAEPIADYRR